jgi:MOSC domain-containing protein YiiM
MMRVEHIFISPGHNFFGRHGLPPGTHPMEAVDRVEGVAGRGLRGDRFFAYQEDYRGQVTLFASDVLAQLRELFKCPQLPAWTPRRNLVVGGADLNALVGQRFRLQEVELEGVEECRPCHWMDTVIAPGAETWLRGRGGLRCRILTDGWFQRDPP